MFVAARKPMRISAANFLKSSPSRLRTLAVDEAPTTTNTMDARLFRLNSVGAQIRHALNFYLNSRESLASVTQLDVNDNLTEWIERLPKQLPAPGLGAVFEESWTEVLFNSRAYHSLPSSLNLLDNARLRSESPGVNSGVIRTSLHAYTPPVTAASSSSRYVTSGIVDTLLGPVIVLALALLTSTFVMFLVEERVSKFGHQIHSCGNAAKKRAVKCAEILESAERKQTLCTNTRMRNRPVHSPRNNTEDIREEKDAGKCAVIGEK
ncbi:hypothetical protein Y032_0003g1664 [Ancylostoma ceylanicum]|uniref:Uncharacterized protein n=1 Tax=Ancylostoma ceylanicum TaxID=53326 RepID=A0A016W009_9BILA|nr:hypothetical protein Y032_0003g1664 [Ancylostoma ceylanicum]